MRYLLSATKLYSIAVLKPLAEILSQENRDWALYAWGAYAAQIARELKPPRHFSQLNAAMQYQPHYVLTPENLGEHRLSGVKIQLFHGLGVEKDSHYKIRAFFDVYFSSGPLVTERFLLLRRNNPFYDVIETGWLKIDGILAYDARGLKEKLNIPPGKRIILYAPTFSRKMQSASLLGKVIPSIMRPDEYWLFKFHPLMPEKLIAAFRGLPQSLLVEDADITPYLHLAELMITDTSSVLYEFYALDKAVITFRALKNPEKALNITETKELRAALDRCLQDPDYGKEIRRSAMARVNPYLDGSSAQRSLAALDSIEPQDYPRAGKPRNLFRKLIVLWRSKKEKRRL